MRASVPTGVRRDAIVAPGELQLWRECSVASRSSASTCLCINRRRYVMKIYYRPLLLAFAFAFAIAYAVLAVCSLLIAMSLVQSAMP